MNTNKTRFRFFQKSLHSCALGESVPSIGKVKGNVQATDLDLQSVMPASQRDILHQGGVLCLIVEGAIYDWPTEAA